VVTALQPATAGPPSARVAGWRRNTRWTLGVFTLVGAALAVYLQAVYKVPLFPQGGSGKVPADVTGTLAPLLVAAAGVERLIEMGWNFLESRFLEVVSWIGMGEEWVEYAHTEVSRARTALHNLIQRADPLDPADGALKTAADSLRSAHKLLESALESQGYTSFKQAASVVAGLILGVIVAFTAGLDMLQLLQLSGKATIAGMLITGLIIGTGSGPVHSIIGLLQQTRNVVGQAADFFDSRAGQNRGAAYNEMRLVTSRIDNSAGNAEGAPRDLPAGGTEGVMGDSPPNSGLPAAPRVSVPAPSAPAVQVTDEQLRIIGL